MKTVGLGPRALHQLVLFAAVVLASCVVGLVVISHFHVLSQSPGLCWQCSATLVPLILIAVFAILQLVVAAVLPVVLLPKLWKGPGFALLFWISVFASMVNAFLPAKAGTGLKAVLFKRLLYTDYTAFGVAHILASGVSLLVSSLVLLVFYWRYVEQILAATVDMIEVPMWPIAVTLLFVSLVVVALRGWIATAGKAALERGGGVWALALMLLIAFLQVVLIGGRAMAAAHLFGVVPAWEKVFFLGAILSLVPLISFVPGGVGIREAVFVWAGLIAGIPIDVSLSAALVDRIAGTALVSLLGSVGLRRIVKTYT